MLSLWHTLNTIILLLYAYLNTTVHVTSDGRYDTKSINTTDTILSKVSINTTNSVSRYQYFRMICKNDTFHLPLLHKLAKKYLCFLTTSVPTERLFSKAGELVSARRSNKISE